MPKDTLASIAQKCGCSISTVSRVLNGNARKFRISDATVRRIKDEVKNSSYVPSALAKGLRTGKTGTLGLLIPSVTDVFFSSIASVIISESRALGYTLFLVDTQSDRELEMASFNNLLSQNVEGIIIIPCSDGDELASRAYGYDIPIVFMDRVNGILQDKTCVDVDNYAGASMAVEYLVERGHKRILCIQGDEEISTSSDRVRGFMDTMSKYGLSEYAGVIGNDFSSEEGYRNAMAALSAKERPTAIFALSGNLMRGVLKAVKELKLNVPEDLSLISFDDNPVYDCMTPGITCVNQPVNDLGSAAVLALKKAIDGGDREGRISVCPNIIERESVKDIRPQSF